MYALEHLPGELLPHALLDACEVLRVGRVRVANRRDGNRLSTPGYITAA